MDDNNRLNMEDGADDTDSNLANGYKIALAFQHTIGLIISRINELSQIRANLRHLVKLQRGGAQLLVSSGTNSKSDIDIETATRVDSLAFSTSLVHSNVDPQIPFPNLIPYPPPKLLPSDLEEGGQALYRRFKLIQTRILPLLLLRLRSINRSISGYVHDHLGEKDLTLSNEKQTFNNLLYELAWFRTRSSDENVGFVNLVLYAKIQNLFDVQSYKTPAWDQAMAEIASSEEEAVRSLLNRKFYHESGDDSFQLNLNLLELEMQARAKRVADLENIKSKCHDSEQEMSKVTAKEGLIVNKIDKLEEIMREILNGTFLQSYGEGIYVSSYTACQVETDEQDFQDQNSNTAALHPDVT